MKNLWRALLAAALLALVARAAEPITIGLSMELTGPLAVVGKTGLLAMQIWAEDVNARGGLLGRPVKLVFYDDQSNSSLVPGIYTKLIDIDKVNLLVSSYGTNLVVPALPVVVQNNRLFFGLFALAANSQFHYPKYFSMLVFGPDAVKTFSKGYFELAAAQTPKPRTVAIVAADAEFSRTASDGARENAKAAGLKIVYDRTYPPTTVDYTPIVRSVQAANPEVVYVASYPPDTVGIIHAVTEIGLKTNMLGGAFVGLPTAALKTQLGPQINGIVNVELWEPVPTMEFPGITEFLKKYQAKAAGEGVDPLGYFLPPFAYSELQILGDAVEAAKTLDKDKLAQYINSHTFHTIVGDIAFGAGWRMDRRAPDLGAIPRHPGQRPGAVQKTDDGRHLGATPIQDRRHDLPLHGGQKIARVDKEITARARSRNLRSPGWREACGTSPRPPRGRAPHRFR